MAPPLPKRRSKIGKILPIAIVVFILLAGAGVGGWFYYRSLHQAPPASAAASLGKFGGIEIGTTGVKMIGVEYIAVAENEVRPSVLASQRHQSQAGRNPRKRVGFRPESAKSKLLTCVTTTRNCTTNWQFPPKTFTSFAAAAFCWSSRIRKMKNATRTTDAKIREKTGITPEFVDSGLEPKYATLGFVPKSERADAVLIDIGGQNIRGGGFDSRGNFLRFSRISASSRSRIRSSRNKRGAKADPLTTSPFCCSTRK